ncbi:hypothetical protein MRX96_023426 [Rhipicephalus microplus]
MRRGTPPGAWSAGRFSAGMSTLGAALSPDGTNTLAKGPELHTENHTELITCDRCPCYPGHHARSEPEPGDAARLPVEIQQGAARCQVEWRHL